MGCDIHIYAEKKVNGAWQLCETEDDAATGQMRLGALNRMIGRNYGLFSILADVRNGYGFAGIKTGEGYHPIAMPRRIPEDASDGYQAIAGDYGCDGHSHSYFTLQELLDYDWTQITIRQGKVPLKEWVYWHQWGKQRQEAPSEFCGDVQGPGIVHISELDAATLIKELDEKDWHARQDWISQHSKTYVSAQWSQPYFSVASHFLATAIPLLLQAADGDYNSVRIVFFFDN